MVSRQWEICYLLIELACFPILQSSFQRPCPGNLLQPKQQQQRSSSLILFSYPSFCPIISSKLNSFCSQGKSKQPFNKTLTVFTANLLEKFIYVIEQLLRFSLRLSNYFLSL